MEKQTAAVKADDAALMAAGTYHPLNPLITEDLTTGRHTGSSLYMETRESARFRDSKLPRQ